MKVVVDANVFVSAAIRTGPPHRIVQAWLERRDFDVVICPAFTGKKSPFGESRISRPQSRSVPHARSPALPMAPFKHGQRRRPIAARCATFVRGNLGSPVIWSSSAMKGRVMKAPGESALAMVAVAIR